HAVLVRTWRDPEHAVKVWQVPPLEPVLSTLERAGVRSVYASLQFAGRLALESEERVVASQAWNERIPGDPLRFRDEVDLDPLAVPWVCTIDGEVVARGPARYGLQWVGGVPRAGKQAVLAVPLGDRRAAEVRLIFQDAGPPLGVWEVFLYGPDEAERPAAGSA